MKTGAAKGSLKEKLGSEKRFGNRVKKGVGERKGIRDPFSKAVADGKVDGWQDSWVFKSVQVGVKKGGGWTQEADLVLVRRTGEIGVVECKLTRSSQSKHGMLEQVLLYRELVGRLKPEEFIKRLEGREISVPGLKATPQAFKSALLNLKSENPSIVPVVVVDRWGKTANRTAGLTLDLLNRCLPGIQIPSVQVFAVNSDGSSVRVDR